MKHYKNQSFDEERALYGSDGVTVEGPEGEKFLPADTVIYAAGMRAEQAAAIALSQCAPEFYMLGDCCVPKNIIAATQPAHTVASLLGTR